MNINYDENFNNLVCNLNEIKYSSWGILNIFNFKTSQYYDNVFILNPYISNIIFFLNEKSFKKVEYSKYEPFRPQVIYFNLAKLQFQYISIFIIQE